MAWYKWKKAKKLSKVYRKLTDSCNYESKTYYYTAYIYRDNTKTGINNSKVGKLYINQNSIGGVYCQPICI